MGKTTVNGAIFRRGLEYAFRACPSPLGGNLSHVVFMRDKIICADGRRWQFGRMPSDVVLVKEPIAFARQSIKMLLKGLDYAHAMVGGVKGEFFVEIKPGELKAVIDYGNKQIIHDLTKASVGDLPKEFDDLISENTPASNDVVQYIHAGHLDDAIAKMSWGVNPWRAVLRGGKGGKDPVRVDVFGDDDGEDRVGTAFLIPIRAQDAILPPDEPLLDKLDRKGGDLPRGQSILHLRTDVFATTPEPPSEEEEAAPTDADPAEAAGIDDAPKPPKKKGATKKKPGKKK